MYLQFFGLREQPFNFTPDPRFLFLTPERRKVLADLTYAILHRKRFILLVGESGIGKTTLIATIAAGLPHTRSRFSIVVTSPPTPADLLEATLLGFCLPEIPSSKGQRLFKLKQFLLQGDAEEKVSTLVIDEAHTLRPEVFAEIVFLGNLDCLQILLVGQTELNQLLSGEPLRTLKQRIALRLTIGPLSESEIEQYIRHRWNKAGGGQQPPFSPEAVASIAEWSKGIPRQINLLCDKALLLAFGQGSSSVTVQHVFTSISALEPGHAVSARINP